MNKFIWLIIGLVLFAVFMFAYGQHYLSLSQAPTLNNTVASISGQYFNIP